MSERYTHISDKERKTILKEQAFLLELPPDKRHELEKRIEKMQKQIDYLLGFIPGIKQIPANDEKDINEDTGVYKNKTS